MPAGWVLVRTSGEEKASPGIAGGALERCQPLVNDSSIAPAEAVFDELADPLPECAIR